MRIGINAGFCEPIRHQVPMIYSRYTDIRQDVYLATDNVQLYTLVNDLRDTAVRPLFIARGNQLHAFRRGERTELLNEPNINGITPEHYAREWNDYAQTAIENGVVVFAGSISNLTQEGLAWLAATWKLMETPPTHVSIHRYPRRNFAQPHKGFDSRDAEVKALRDIIGNTSFAVTEFGYHTARQYKWIVVPFRWSEQQVFEYTVQEYQFWKSKGAESAYIYQLNDGPTDTHINRYGVRYADGDWKLVARAQDWIV